MTSFDPTSYDPTSYVHETVVSLIRALVAIFDTGSENIAKGLADRQLIISRGEVGIRFSMLTGINVDLRWGEAFGQSPEEAERFSHSLGKASRLADAGVKALNRKPADVSWREISEYVGANLNSF